MYRRFLILAAFCLLSFGISCARPSSAHAEEFPAYELATFIGEAKSVCKTPWRVSYNYQSRTVHLTSQGKVSGSLGGGHPAFTYAEMPLSVTLRLTGAPTPERKRKRELAEAARKSHLESMSENAQRWAGYHKISPRTLSEEEWSEYLLHEEHKRRVELLAEPTHSYGKLYFVAKNYGELYGLNPKQNAAAKRVIADYHAMLGVLSRL